MHKAVLIITEDEEGRVEVYSELDPELTDEQREGREDLNFCQYLTGLLVDAIGQSLERLGMDRIPQEEKTPDL